MLKISAVALLAALPFLSGCMFDVVSVKEVPVAFTPVGDPVEVFQIYQDFTVKIGTGFPSMLKANTRWVMIGRIPQGRVFTSKDQVMTVEASNIHEAAIVVEGDQLVGFFLLVEKTFCPAKTKIKIQ